MQDFGVDPELVRLDAHERAAARTLVGARVKVRLQERQLKIVPARQRHGLTKLQQRHARGLIVDIYAFRGTDLLKLTRHGNTRECCRCKSRG